MKNVQIKKSKYFSHGSKIFVHVGSRKIHLKGFELYTVPIDEQENISVSHLWTSSSKINYDQLENGVSLVIKPRLNRFFALIVGIVFLLCLLISIFTGSRWSYIPLIPFIIYIGIYLTVLKNRYLIIEKDKEAH